MYGKTEKRNIKAVFCFSIFVFTLLAASVVITAMAAEKSGMYWAAMNEGSGDESRQISNKGFVMVDVSDSYAESCGCGSTDRKAAEKSAETEIVPLGVGPTPSIPSLTEEELKLYGLLSKGNGFISNEDKSELDGNVHWREIVIEPEDTLDSVAAEYGLTAKDLRRANDMKPNQKIKNAEVLLIPDSADFVLNTLAYVKKLKKAEEDLKKRGKPIEVTAYVVKQGDSLWSIAAEFGLDLDTIVGSNKLEDINRLKLGTVLRIPNQDGIFVKVKKNDNVQKLADKYGSYKEAVFRANSLAPEATLIAGKELFLPGAKLLAVVETTNKSGKKIKSATSRRISSVARGKFRWPIAGQISSPFGWRKSPFGRRRVLHAGIDIRAPRGRGIKAAADGRVVHSGWMGGYGYTIVIQHSGGFSTLYGHCSKLVAKRGAVVKRGQLIARVGSTGRSTGNHLHFEVRRGGTPVNPIKYLR
jgi:murein DD-endopeptidase MepM/ murein hydrolase activator NlpD